MSQAHTNGSAPITTTADELEKLLSRETVKRATVPIENGVLCPKNFEGIQRLAQFMFASGMVPKGVETEPQCMMLVAAGTEAGLGLGQIAKGCMVVNMRPSIWGDVALGLCRRSVLCESIVEVVEGDVATCTCRRKGEPAPIVRTFSVEEAKKAGLWGKSGPWTSYPKRMLQMRARAFALRDAFPDLLCGLSIAEEVMDYETAGREPAPQVAANGHTAASAIAALGQTTTLPQDSPPAAGPAAGDKTSDGAGSVPDDPIKRVEAAREKAKAETSADAFGAEMAAATEKIAQENKTKAAGTHKLGDKIRQTKHDPKNVPDPIFSDD